MVNHSGAKIRVIVVDDFVETAQTVRKWLATVPEVQVVAIATSAYEGIQLAVRHQPDVVLMDVHMPEMSGLEATKIIAREVPTQVILMSVDDSKEAELKAYKAGARDYLPKPLRSDDVVRVIRRVAEMPGGGRGMVDVMPPPPSRTASPRGQHVIAVCGAKGGIGRSIIAANLAIALKALAGDVLLVDGNLQSGDLHVLLHMDDAPNPIEQLREPQDLDYDAIQRILPAHESGVRLLRAPDRLEDAALLQEDVMKAILVEVREHFDIVVIDVDSSYSDATAAALEAADRLLVVTTPEITSINRVKTFLEVTQRLEIPLERCWLICNRFDGGYQISPKRVEQSLGRPFAALLPDDVRTVINSVNRGMPFITSQRRAPLSRAISDLANKVYQDLTTPKIQQPHKGKLFGLGR